MASTRVRLNRMAQAGGDAAEEGAGNTADLEAQVADLTTRIEVAEAAIADLEARVAALEGAAP